MSVRCPVNHPTHHAEGSAPQFAQVGVSNSEGTSSCERAWFFGYHPETKLAPNSFGVARTRGIVGHKVLETFYREVQQETDYDTAVNRAMEYFESERKRAFMLCDAEKLEMLNYLRKLLVMYFEHYESDIRNWEILDVEGFHLLEWEGEKRIYLPMRLDLVIYQKGGAFKGETSPVDHKFTNDFWNEYKIRLSSQMPLYIRALRASRWAGKREPVVKRSVVNQIRTRSLKDPFPSEIFRRVFVPANEHGMEKIFDNHRKKALQKARWKGMPAGEVYEETTSEWGSANCQFCDFKALCAIDLEGGNLQTTIAAEYQRSDYGYPSMEELRNER